MKKWSNRRQWQVIHSAHTAAVYNTKDVYERQGDEGGNWYVETSFTRSPQLLVREEHWHLRALAADAHRVLQ